MSKENEYAYENKSGEHQVYGSPGTGKSTYLSKQIVHAVEKYGSNEIIVTSFTRAAAAELVSRNLPVDADRVATLHAHAYRSIGKPKLVETDKDLLRQWNDEHQHWALGVGNVDVDDPLADETPQGMGAGDEVFGKYQLLRARLRDVQLFPQVRAFADAWESFKRQTGSIDFTDMIDLALQRVPCAPGNPRVMFVDEAQDMTALEWSLVRKWGKHTQHFIVAGDDDQCIYAFKGARAETFFESNLPPERKHILHQSHRVPVTVHELANKWVAGLTKREPKLYKPRVDKQGQPVQGSVRWFGRGANFLNCDPLLDDAEQQLDDGRTVMFLTTCAYMLQNIKSELRARGHVFHNPFRKKRGDWNPLGKGKGVEALLAFLAPHMRGFPTVAPDREGWKLIANTPLWSGEELRRWVGETSVSKFLVRGAGKAIAEWASDERHVGVEFDGLLQDVFELVPMVNGDLNWFLDKVSKANEKKYEYLCRVARQRSVRALTEPARIIIGTIHSVKGGEADVVYLMPDLSRKGFESYSNIHTRDEVVRQMYVGITRCRDTLVMCDPAADYYVKGLSNL